MKTESVSTDNVKELAVYKCKDIVGIMNKPLGYASTEALWPVSYWIWLNKTPDNSKVRENDAGQAESNLK